MNKLKYEGLFKPQKSNLAIFHDLMPFKVREILLVATVYDAYILEREGQLFEQIYGEYYQLNISSAPRITSVFSIDDAIEHIQNGHFDLVIVVTGIDRKMPAVLSSSIKSIRADLPVLLLINNNNQISIYEKEKENLTDVEKMFVWNGDSSIFLAMIKYIEDSFNAVNDTMTGDVRIILVVEDSIRYYSRYLPTLYSVIMKELQRQISGEDIDARYKILKMRARPKVLLASTYEEAVKLYEKYKEYLLCIITDVKYPMAGRMSDKAGRKLVNHIKENLSVPILMQSSDPANESFAETHKLGYIDKNSKKLTRNLVDFFKTNLGFGNFIFRDLDGSVHGEARYLKEFEAIIGGIPDESITYHSNRNDFSTWFMAKGEIKSALQLKKVKTEDFKSSGDIKNYIRDILRQRRLDKKRDSISNFTESFFRESCCLMRISNGSVGGKGRGIAFIESLMQMPEFKRIFNNINVTIPGTVIIGTDEYEYFMEQVDFSLLMRGDTDYEEIRKLFGSMKISSLLSQRLKKVLSHFTGPLAVRSSGLFEDSLSQPFAGIYETCFLPNNHPDPEERLRQLETSIKMVYSSVFTPLAKSYFESVNHSVEEEKMAVIIQKVTGNNYDGYFYPHISGIAQSWNYYPFSHMKPEDGIGLLAVGLGKSVVEGEDSFRFCPQYPRMSIMTIRDMLQNTQRNFYALSLKNSSVNLLEGSDAGLEKLPVEIAEKHGTLTSSASVYDAFSNSVKPGLHMPGPRIIDFSYILKYDQIPLAETVSRILDIMGSALGTPVEIEFSVDLTKDSEGKAFFNLLQVKPLIRSLDTSVVDTGNYDPKDLIIYTDRGMGNGIIDDIKDIIYVVPEHFDRMKTTVVAGEVLQINRLMKNENLKYILIGPGRWGSSDPFLGIPVDWTAISEAGIIVETGMKDFNVEASLGSHFFHNITSMNIGYFTISNRSPESFIDYDYLSSAEEVQKTEYLRHIRFHEPIRIIMDGKQSVSIVTKSGIK